MGIEKNITENEVKQFAEKIKELNPSITQEQINAFIHKFNELNPESLQLLWDSYTSQVVGNDISKVINSEVSLFDEYEFPNCIFYIPSRLDHIEDIINNLKDAIRNKIRDEAAATSRKVPNGPNSSIKDEVLEVYLKEKIFKINSINDIREKIKSIGITEEYINDYVEKAGEFEIPGPNRETILAFLLFDIDINLYTGKSNFDNRQKLRKYQNLISSDERADTVPSEKLIEEMLGIIDKVEPYLKREKDLYNNILNFLYSPDLKLGDSSVLSRAHELESRVKCKAIQKVIEICDGDVERVDDQLSFIIQKRLYNKERAESLADTERYKRMLIQDKEIVPLIDEYNILYREYKDGKQLSKEKLDKFSALSKKIKPIIDNEITPKLYKNPLNSKKKFFGGDLNAFLAQLSTSEKKEFYDFATQAERKEHKRLLTTMQILQLEKTFGKDKLISDEHCYVYRAGNFDGKNIEARDKQSDKSLIDHVSNGSSSDNYLSPFISTTFSPLVMGTYIYNDKKPEMERAKYLAIDVSTIYKYLLKEQEKLNDDSLGINGETRFLELCEQNLVLSDVVKSKIARRKSEISINGVYEENNDLPDMIFDISDEKNILNEHNSLKTMANKVIDIAQGKVDSKKTLSFEFNPRSNMQSKVDSTKAYGMSSLEVLFKGTIPARLGETRVIHELDPLFMDVIQAKAISEGKIAYNPNELIGRYINDKDSASKIPDASEAYSVLVENKDAMNLNPVDLQFMRMYYIDNKPVKDIVNEMISNLPMEYRNSERQKLEKIALVKGREEQKSEEEKDEYKQEAIAFALTMRERIMDKLLAENSPLLSAYGIEHVKTPQLVSPIDVRTASKTDQKKIYTWAGIAKKNGENINVYIEKGEKIKTAAANAAKRLIKLLEHRIDNEEDYGK